MLHHGLTRGVTSIHEVYATPFLSVMQARRAILTDHTCLHAYIHTYIHTHTDVHTCIHTYDTYVRTYIHTYIHTKNWQNWRVNQLSDGKKRKVQLLLAFLLPSKVLLLDEVCLRVHTYMYYMCLSVHATFRCSCPLCF
jgi:ATPase subunit of ABC transporter with duplicated ATPase domains